MRGIFAMLMVGLLVVSVRQSLFNLRIAAASKPMSPVAFLRRVIPEKVLVGPNILVDHDFDAPHGESFLAISPQNSNHLIDASMTFARTDEGTYVKTYSSADGGKSWNDAAPLGDRSFIRSYDPQVAFGVAGTAYLALLRDGNGPRMWVYRSMDGGLGWQRTAQLQGADHEQLAVDTSQGPHRGRVYISIPQRGKMYLYSSDDDGRTFVARRLTMSVGDVQAQGLVVLRDGTLVVGMMKYTAFGGAKPNPQVGYHFESVFSTNGGSSFSSRHTIANSQSDVAIRDVPGSLSILHDMTRDADWTAQLAGDSSKGPYKNRLYAAWPAFIAGHGRIYTAYSTDRGSSWSRPIPVGIGSVRGDGNGHAALAVNANGVVGLTFHHVPAYGTRRSFDLYFTASTNGGRSWLSPVRVSSQTSSPASNGNLGLMAEIRSPHADGLGVLYFSAFSESPFGGEYMGLAADSAGAFHALWQDSRSGTSHLYTARVELIRGNGSQQRGIETPHSLNTMVTLSFDSTVYDPRSGDYALPIRLRNTSQTAIRAPITVRLTQYQARNLPVRSFSVLNATNGERGVGAVIDYTKALGASRELLPGALTEAVVWRIHLNDPADLATLFLKFDARGHVAKK